MMSNPNALSEAQRQRSFYRRALLSIRATLALSPPAIPTTLDSDVSLSVRRSPSTLIEIKAQTP
jgi:hypothetical protein